MESFSKWLDEEELKTSEVSTCTGQIAGFARPIFGVLNTRMYAPPVMLQVSNEDKKKKDGKNLS